MTDAIAHGDALTILRTLPDASVQCCISSPPYWGLRDYGVEGQWGLERTPQEYVTKMVEVFREVRRMLREDGTLWLNMGDSYASGKGSCFNPGGGESSFKDCRKEAGVIPLERLNVSGVRACGLKPKDLCGIPWRVAFALQADGWYLRQDIIWHKPNPMPESVRDRCTKAHEYVFLMSKSPRYYYDGEAIKEKATPCRVDYTGSQKNNTVDLVMQRTRMKGRVVETGDKRNRRSVWTVPTAPFPDVHFATFPPDLIKPMVMAGTPPKCCGVCGAAWERILDASKYEPEVVGVGTRFVDASRGDKTRKLSGHDYNQQVSSRTLGWRPICDHNDDTGRSIVLDPFMGAGTVALVAKELGRHYIGIELNAEYIRMAERRLRQEVLL